MCASVPTSDGPFVLWPATSTVDTEEEPQHDEGEERPTGNWR